MKNNLIILVFIFFSLPAAGQNKKNYSVYLYFQPELTFYKNNYAFRWRDTYTKDSWNFGVQTNLKVDLTKRFFSEIGLGFVSRKLTTIAFLNQTVLPPPHQSWTMELVGTKSVSLRTFEIPVNFGYNFITRSKTNIFFTSGISVNYLLNTFYEVGFQKYQDTYPKKYWQGISLNFGVGSDYRISKNIRLTGRVSYSAVNTVKEDNYLFSQDVYGISLPHKFLKMSFGVGHDF
ncbi:MAG: outer membrane beta-barrel protein [Chitinophagaceae bacterium]|nr:outer membrane beta-barrel protein [Chitinophagaceae bacterium]